MNSHECLSISRNAVACDSNKKHAPPKTQFHVELHKGDVNEFITT